MKIRKAEERDIPRLLALLGQVLQIHAEIRPDVFIPGTTKYTVCELAELMKQEDKPIYVAVNEDDVCMGYAFCQMQEQPFSTNMAIALMLASFSGLPMLMIAPAHLLSLFSMIRKRASIPSEMSTKQRFCSPPSMS